MQRAMPHTYPPPLTRNLITLFALAGAFMTQLDATIANVALPHMQASTSASREQITWVLTSYIIMAAIFTPLSGWLADRFGRKRIMMISLLGFTGASMLCGLAVNLDQLIAFRMLQGMLGAALLPMSQAILLDINPPEKHGPAMALWGMGAILGPIIGPLLGGWLTENLSWRWVFFVNLPFGIMAALGLMLTLGETRHDSPSRFDLFGFGMLALAIGAFQLMLDRGQMEDWFQSTEIWIEATVAAFAFYIFLVHSFTARRPFVNLGLFRDSNFVFGSVLGFFLGGLMYGVLALLAPMLADLMGYPIEYVGLVTAPRGLGTLVSVFFVGRAIGRVDARLLIFIGLLLCAWSTWIMAQFSLQMDSWPVIVSGFIQGVGAGIMFVPITTVVFATMKPQFRNEGAALNSLIRNLGASVWISVLQTMTIRNEAVVHSRLAEGVRPDNPVTGLHMPDFDFGAVQSIAQMHAEIGRQALMVSYVDAFWFLCVASLVVAPLALLLRPMRNSPPGPIDLS
jgi:MFS transporter, DHA2 family, multidrug resistance protein